MATRHHGQLEPGVVTCKIKLLELNWPNERELLMISVSVVMIKHWNFNLTIKARPLENNLFCTAQLISTVHLIQSLTCVQVSLTSLLCESESLFGFVGPDCTGVCGRFKNKDIANGTV